MTVAFSSRVLLWCYQSAITFFISSSSGSHSSNKFRCSLPYLIRAVQPFLPWLLLNHGTENVLMKFTDTSLWLSQWTLYSSSFSQSLTCIQTVECNLVLKDFFFFIFISLLLTFKSCDPFCWYLLLTQLHNGYVSDGHHLILPICGFNYNPYTN